MKSSEELILFYNTENFFPPDTKPVHKLDPTKSGLWNWDERRYKNKLHKIANVFRLVEEKEGVLPVLIGISEIQNDSVIEELIALEPFNSKYGYVHYDSMDERGVDVALCYDKSKVEIIHSEPISYFFPFDDDPDDYDTTRDVLFCKVKLNEEILNIFVVHLPSKRDKDINKSKRNHILTDLRNRIFEIINNEKESVIICGDFNDNPNEELIKNVQIDKNSNKILRNPFEILFENKNYSTFHYKHGLLFDQIMLSVDFFNSTKIQFLEAKVFNPREISNWDKKFKGRPFRTYAGTRYIGGYSDHFPVFVKIKMLGTRN